MNKYGFTLAEVLITLGVIGVVTALTLSTLINNYQKTVWVSQLKKSYSIIEHGFQKMMADEGVDKLSNVGFFSVFNSNEDVMCTTPNSNSNNMGECKQFFEGWQRYFVGNYGKFGHEMNFLWNDGYDDYPDDGALILNDGTQIEIIFYNMSLKQYNVIGFVWIDINGIKKPNTYGRDIFGFQVGDNGKLYPIGGKEDYITKHNGNASGYVQGAECLNKNNGGVGDNCTARIIENGWKMDY